MNNRGGGSECLGSLPKYGMNLASWLALGARETEPGCVGRAARGWGEGGPAWEHLTQRPAPPCWPGSSSVEQKQHPGIWLRFLVFLSETGWEWKATQHSSIPWRSGKSSRRTGQVGVTKLLHTSKPRGPWSSMGIRRLWLPLKELRGFWSQQDSGSNLPASTC